ncbi:arginyltransferase [Psychrobacter sp.]|uniref:arginyltransferase n=1 Tax=Psychrobacter sp. TaxID=56811 RepID=UPI0025CD8DD1|nr:arginyltransferase [Psychrobacter sp.]
MHLYADNDVNRSDIVTQENIEVEDSFHISAPSLCSYLPNQVSQLTFILLDAQQSIDPKLYTHLCTEGFRRSGNAFYKPNCHYCVQCISSRVVVNDFVLSRRYRKVLNRNNEVSIGFIPAIQATKEHYALYQKYIHERHADGDMYPPSLHTFEQFLVESPAKTQFMEVREANNRLIAVAVTDSLCDGLSSIYTFFDPDPSYHSRSLGVFCILSQIETAKQLGLDYVYLGFWIPSVKKMSYKTDYAPIELLINNHWTYFEQIPDTEEVLNLLNLAEVKLVL